MSGYLAPDIPAKQWEVVEPQLAALHRGDALPAWEAVGEALGWLYFHKLAQMSLLDVGCSSAYFSEIIEYYVPGRVQYTGMDYSPYMVQEAAKHYPSVQVELGDILNIDYPPCAFDIVMTGATINHIHDWQRALKELAGIAKHYLLFHRLPFVDSSPRLEAAAEYGHPVLAVFFNEAEFGAVLAGAGFDCIYDKPVEDLRTQIWERG